MNTKSSLNRSTDRNNTGKSIPKNRTLFAKRNSTSKNSLNFNINLETKKIRMRASGMGIPEFSEEFLKPETLSSFQKMKPSEKEKLK